jgi:hypothetical protein
MAGTYADPVFEADVASPLSHAAAESGPASRVTPWRLASISSITRERRSLLIPIWRRNGSRTLPAKAACVYQCFTPRLGLQASNVQGDPEADTGCHAFAESKGCSEGVLVPRFPNAGGVLHEAREDIGDSRSSSCVATSSIWRLASSSAPPLAASSRRSSRTSSSRLSVVSAALLPWA